jgi:hypothetical protein
VLDRVALKSCCLRAKLNTSETYWMGAALKEENKRRNLPDKNSRTGFNPKLRKMVSDAGTRVLLEPRRRPASPYRQRRRIGRSGRVSAAGNGGRRRG